MEGRWSCELQEVTALVPSSSGHSHSQNFSPGLHPRPKVGGGSAPCVGSGAEVSAVFVFFQGRSKQRLGCPQTAVQWWHCALNRGWRLSPEVQCSGEETWPALHLQKGRGVGHVGSREGELGSPHLCTRGPWLLGPSPGQLVHSSLPCCGHRTLSKCFLRDKVTLSFSSPPILVACRGLDAGRTAWFPYLLRSSRTLKELNGKENRSYCLFCFLFKTYKKTLNPWSGLLQPQDCFLCHGNMLHKRLFPGLAPWGCPSPAAENCCHSWK